MMTDPVADMLTRIRNALMAGHETVSLPASREKEGIAGVLKAEGYIADVRVVGEAPHRLMKIYLKYGPEGEDVVTALKRQSKPSRRIYRGVDDIPRVLNGLGIAILSTPKGILSDRECRRERVGGELICTVQ